MESINLESVNLNTTKYKGIEFHPFIKDGSIKYLLNGHCGKKYECDSFKDALDFIDCFLC